MSEVNDLSLAGILRMTREDSAAVFATLTRQLEAERQRAEKAEAEVARLTAPPPREKLWETLELSGLICPSTHDPEREMLGIWEALTGRAALKTGEPSHG